MDQPLEYYPIHYDELESYLVGYLNGEEAGGGLCTARGTEVIQVQVVRVHGMTSR